LVDDWFKGHTKIQHSLAIFTSSMNWESLSYPTSIFRLKYLGHGHFPLFPIFGMAAISWGTLKKTCLFWDFQTYLEHTHDIVCRVCFERGCSDQKV